MLDNSIRAKHDSVEVLPKSKDRVRTYVHSLRDCVEQANMTAAKREALLRKLDEFEQGLEVKRLSLISIARMTLELLALPGGIWASAEVTNCLIHNVMQIVAEAKAAEDESKQLPPVTNPKALSPPREKKSSFPAFFGPYRDRSQPVIVISTTTCHSQVVPHGVLLGSKWMHIDHALLMRGAITLHSGLGLQTDFLPRSAARENNVRGNCPHDP